MKISGIRYSIIVLMVILTAGLTFCTFSEKTAPVSVYYYELNGWQNTGKTQFLMNEIRKRLTTKDFYLNSQNEIIDVNRSTYVEIDSLHKMQKVVHRIEFLDPNHQYHPDDILIRINFIKEETQDVIRFNAEKQIYLKNKGWKSVTQYEPREILHLENRPEIDMVNEISLALVGLSFQE